METIRIDKAVAEDIAVLCQWFGLALDEHRDIFRAAHTADPAAFAAVLAALAAWIRRQPACDITARIRLENARRKEMEKAA